MQAISSLKLLKHAGRLAGDRRPITADIFLTTACNNNCSWCTYKKWGIENSYSMQYEDFVRYVERLLQIGVQGVILTGGGEPTCNPDFQKMCAFLEKRAIPYGVNTNLNLPVRCKADFVKVSLDGYDRDSYKAIRGVDAYEKVCRNIIEYSEWKKKHSPNTNLGIQVVATSLELAEKFYEANRGLPADYISFRPVESTAGEFYLTDKAEKIKEYLEKLSDLDDRVVVNYKWDHLDLSFDRCSAHWAQIALNEHGQVMYCCNKPTEIICDVMDENLLFKYLTAETDMSKCNIPCRMTGPNMLMETVEEETRNACFI